MHSTSFVILDKITCTRFAKTYLLERSYKYARQVNGYVMPVYFEPTTIFKEVGHPNLYNTSSLGEATQKTDN